MALSGKALIAAQGVPQVFPSVEPFGSKVLTIQAMTGNTGRIAVGYTGAVKAASDLSEMGIQLDAGQSVQVRTLHCDAFYIDGTHTGDGFTYLIVPAE